MSEITLCVLAKNEAESIHGAIMSAKKFVSEVLVVDDHSTDSTEINATLAGAKVVTLPFTVKERGFAAAANWMIDQAKHEWILIVDADELLAEPERIHTLMRYQGKEVWALPRRKWFEYPRLRMEYERYPDWQVRFFKKGSGRFTGEMHVTYRTDKRVHFSYRGPHIEHLQTQFRSADKQSHRADLYPGLAAKQGVTVHGGDILKVV